MERQLWLRIVAVLKTVAKPRDVGCCTFTNERVVLVWFWAVVHDRPVSWACQASSWPVYMRKHKLPSSTTMSRRLRSQAVKTLIDEIEKATLRKQEQPSMYWMIDGKPLIISAVTKDRQSGYGRAAGGKAKGYKLHAIVSVDGCYAAWRIAPMNKDERVMARRLVRESPINGYLVGDGNYDSNPLHEVCGAQASIQLVAMPKGGLGKLKRRKKQSLGRQRSLDLLENPNPEFAMQLIRDRDQIERHFANLTSWGGGLSHLPPWARTHRRVHRWVKAKLILNDLKRRSTETTYVESRKML